MKLLEIKTRHAGKYWVISYKAGKEHNKLTLVFISLPGSKIRASILTACNFRNFAVKSKYKIYFSQEFKGKANILFQEQPFPSDSVRCSCSWGYQPKNAKHLLPQLYGKLYHCSKKTVEGYIKARKENQSTIKKKGGRSRRRKAHVQNIILKQIKSIFAYIDML